MAELNYDRMDGAEGPPLPGLGKVINFSGAVISLGLIAGLGWWGYQLMVRDVSGVPVVRALEGPMRIAPEDPGGEMAAHTGLAVNNVPAEGIAAEPADRLVLAAEPSVLVPEDLPEQDLAELIPPAGEDASPPLPVEEESSTQALVTEDGQVAEPDVQDEIDNLISAALTEATGSVRSPDGGTLSLVPVDAGGVTRSLLPVPRPDDLAAIDPLPVAADGVVSVPASDIASGTRLAQLGAFDSETVAMQEWVRLSEKFPEFMTDKARVIEKAQSGGKLFYRLRAEGFEDLNDARRFCAALLLADASCIPVKQR